jgi:hypothetical protein
MESEQVAYFQILEPVDFAAALLKFVDVRGALVSSPLQNYLQFGRPDPLPLGKLRFSANLRKLPITGVSVAENVDVAALQMRLLAVLQ